VDGPIFRRLSNSSSQRCTHTACPQCRTVVRGRVLVRTRDVIVEGTCPEHGHFSGVLSRHPDFWLAVHKWVSPEPPGPLRFRGPDARHVNNIYLDLTGRCNLRCVACLASSPGGARGREPKLEEVLRALEVLGQKRPIIFLSGGEPTLRADLPEWIRVLSARGHLVKLLSNGVRLDDPAYVQSLADAGLRWVLLQFDSRSDTALSALRGRQLAKARDRVVDLFTAAGVNVGLSCMVRSGINDGELWDLVRYAASKPGVRQITFLPMRRIGVVRDSQNGPSLEGVDLMDLLEAQSGGRIRRADFLNALALQAIAWRLTRWPPLAVRPCFFPLLLDTSDGEPRALLRWPPSRDSILSLARWLWSMVTGHLPEMSLPPRGLMVLTIETYHELEALDLDDARTCSRYYLADGFLTPACIYNNLFRETI